MTDFKTWLKANAKTYGGLAEQYANDTQFNVTGIQQGREYLEKHGASTDMINNFVAAYRNWEAAQNVDKDRSTISGVADTGINR